MKGLLGLLSILLFALLFSCEDAPDEVYRDFCYDGKKHKSRGTLFCTPGSDLEKTAVEEVVSMENGSKSVSEEARKKAEEAAAIKKAAGRINAESFMEDDGTIMPSANTEGISNGDWVIVSGVLKNNGIHYSPNDFWASEIKVLD